MVNHKKISDEHDHFFLLTLFTLGFFVSNVLRKVVDLTTLNILRTTRAMLMNFCIINTQRGQILIFRLFRPIFTCGKVKGNTTKRQKTSAFKYFLLPRHFKVHSEIKSPVQRMIYLNKV